MRRVAEGSCAVQFAQQPSMHCIPALHSEASPEGHAVAKHEEPPSSLPLLVPLPLPELLPLPLPLLPLLPPPSLLPPQ
jgi:hypothetical protein